MATSKQTLERVLLKAHKAGWEPLSTIPWKNVSIEQWTGHRMVGIALLYRNGDSSVQWVRELEGIIFNHDFAQHLWGVELNDSAIEPEHWAPNWEYHLQRMVVAPDPIKYLEENA